MNVDHPAIPKLFEAQYEPQADEYITFVMENVGDFNADQIVLGRHPRPSIGEAVEIARQMLSALEHLHVVHRLVHRDIKPDNIRLSADLAHAWLVDFNYAGLLNADGVAVGAQTPFSWMAPEVPETGQYTATSEIFALGVVLYELITGQYLAGSYELAKQEERVTSGKRAFPDIYYNRWPPDVPRSVRKVITKAMRSDPAKRWASAAAMRTALGKCIYVDWRQDPDQANRWEGSWPSTRHDSQRISVEVETWIVTRGPNSGQRRARARYRPATNWRRLPRLPDRTVESDSALAQFFDDVERRLASIRPAS